MQSLRAKAQSLSQKFKELEIDEAECGSLASLILHNVGEYSSGIQFADCSTFSRATSAWPRRIWEAEGRLAGRASSVPHRQMRMPCGRHQTGDAHALPPGRSGEPYILLSPVYQLFTKFLSGIRGQSQRGEDHLRALRRGQRTAGLIRRRLVFTTIKCAIL